MPAEGVGQRLVTKFLDRASPRVPNHRPMRPPFIASRLAALVLMLTLTAAIPPVEAADVAVTECGVRFSGYGYLVRDLDCSGYQYGVELGNGTLNLSGHTLVGGEYGVLCHGSCKVVNGTVEGAREDGIAAIKNLKVINVTSRDNGFTGVKAGAAVYVERSTLTGNVRSGAQGLRRVKFKNVVSRDNGFGTDGNALVVLLDSQIFDNAKGGVWSDRIVAKRSTIRDNHSGAECGVTLPCADLHSPLEGRAPKLKESTCETSHRGGTFITGETWGVCSLD